MTSNATPEWLRRRALGRTQRQSCPASLSSSQRLALETSLVGHSACVNCLDWNLSGNLLLSGSDDRSVIIWDAFKRRKQAQLRTSHTGNIFSVKFIRNKSDTQIATCASDAKVKVVDITGEKTILNCDSCHSDRIKRLATHTNQPDLIWSAGEDGLIMQYDLRQSHQCRPKNAFIDLKSSFNSPTAKSIAVNPIKDEMLAVGGNDAIVRIYDRRYVPSPGCGSAVGNSSLKGCPSYYCPGHLASKAHRTTYVNQVYGISHVAFSPDGTELLANLRSEQIYLFDLIGNSTKQVQLEVPKLRQKCTEFIHEQNETNPTTKSPMKGDSNELYAKAFAKLGSSETGMSRKLNMNEINQINKLLNNQKHNFQSHQLKAAALVDRNWRGDLYESMRESLKALELNPMDSKSWLNISYTVNQYEYQEMAIDLLDIMRLVHDKYLSMCDYQRTVLDYDSNEINFATNLLLQTIGIPSKPPTPIDELSFADGVCDSFDEIMQPVDGSVDETAVNRFKRSWRSKSFSDERGQEETIQLQQALDYSKRFCGHCNMNTDIKEASFFGLRDEFIVAGSDDGALYIWDKQTTNLVKAIQADMHIVNCVQAHPSVSMLATSGIEASVKIWSPTGRTNKDVQALEVRCNQNSSFVSADPLDAMMMMFYPNYNH